MNWFKKTLEFSGYPLRKAQEYLKQIDKLVNQNAEDYSTQHKWDIFKYHSDKNQFYNGFCNRQGVKYWSDIPILEKKHLQIPLQNRLSKEFQTNHVFKNSTSGSSGHPFSFAKDKYAHALTWAHIISLYQNYGIEMGKSLEARFYGISKSGLARQKELFKDKLAHRFRFDVFDLSEKNLDHFLTIFSRIPFQFINGYTSSIVRFANYLKTIKVVLKDVCPTLKICITTSEMLFESDKILLREQFGIPIVNEYGAAELGIIAFENSNKIWALNQKTLYVEILDNQGYPLGYNREGNIVITSLYNKAHPFIRYKIGDRGMISKDAVNGTPVLESLTGRTNDFVYLPSGKVVPALTFYYITKTAIEVDKMVKEFLVEQTHESTFNIIYVSNLELNEAQKSKIEEAIKEYLEPGLNINFIKKEHIQRSKSGKLKQFVSRL